MLIIAGVGAVTALYASFAALAQWDLKKMLAYSTISQVGYMFLAVGAGDIVGGLFHLVSHAFFKALLFLTVGIVIQALAEEHNIFRMGNLRRRLPVVYWLFLIGAVSLSAFPLLGGFFSKDRILLATFILYPGATYKIFWLLGLAGGLSDAALYLPGLLRGLSGADRPTGSWTRATPGGADPMSVVAHRWAPGPGLSATWHHDPIMAITGCATPGHAVLQLTVDYLKQEIDRAPAGPGPLPLHGDRRVVLPGPAGILLVLIGILRLLADRDGIGAHRRPGPGCPTPSWVILGVIVIAVAGVAHHGRARQAEAAGGDGRASTARGGDGRSRPGNDRNDWNDHRSDRRRGGRSGDPRAGTGGSQLMAGTTTKAGATGG